MRKLQRQPPCLERENKSRVWNHKKKKKGLEPRIKKFNTLKAYRLVVLVEESEEQRTGALAAGNAGGSVAEGRVEGGAVEIVIDKLRQRLVLERLDVKVHHLEERVAGVQDVS
eukprot:2659317-Rhodomonas_salina.2